MSTMVISCKHSCVSAGHHAHAPSGRSIWEELKSNCDAHASQACRQLSYSFCRVLRSTLLLLLSHNSDSQSVNRLPKSFVVLPFVVVICVLFMAVAMLYLEGLRALSGVLTTLGTLYLQAVRPSKSHTMYIPWPPNLTIT